MVNDSHGSLSSFHILDLLASPFQYLHDRQSLVITSISTTLSCSRSMQETKPLSDAYPLRCQLPSSDTSQSCKGKTASSSSTSDSVFSGTVSCALMLAAAVAMDSVMGAM